MEPAVLYIYVFFFFTVLLILSYSEYFYFCLKLNFLYPGILVDNSAFVNNNIAHRC